MTMPALAWYPVSLELQEQEAGWSCLVLRERLAALMSLRGLQARSAEAAALRPGYPSARARFAALVSKAGLPAAGLALRAMLELERAPGQSRCPALPERLTAPVHRQVQRGQSAGAWQRNPPTPAWVPRESAAVPI
jgi:hypothetical protein